MLSFALGMQLLFVTTLVDQAVVRGSGLFSIRPNSIPVERPSFAEVMLSSLVLLPPLLVALEGLAPSGDPQVVAVGPVILCSVFALRHLVAWTRARNWWNQWGA